MTSEYIESFITTKCDEFKLIALKGFAPSLIVELGKSFCLLDSYAIRNDKVILEDINEIQLMLSIMNYNDNKPAICTIESLIKLCAYVKLDVFRTNICVLENNFCELYPNPSNANIPDFDSDNIMDADMDNAPYCAYYSYCVEVNGVQFVQYIDNYSINSKNISVKKLAKPISNYHFDISENISGSRHISAKDGSLDSILAELYDSMSLSETEFMIEPEEENNERVLTLLGAANMLNCNIHISIISRNLEVTPRQELYVFLNRIWGYSSFRELKIYKDLAINRDVSNVSQGSIIETVIRQAEYAFHNDYNKVSNVLLTSPTGAGKSLLFQLSAIYLAEKYGLLTIVVSPLVALMNDQVVGLTNYDGVAALNSNKSASEKESIMSGIKDGSINLLYLSPELLLSYSITTFIGQRKLGLLVVDEAHTVTTWGRDFRVDYWFLGDYLRKSRKILNYPFPIFALTATAVWDPSGNNDMVFDTIRSLNMDPCIKFIGVVRRSNIKFEIEQSNITKNYENLRQKLTISRIKEAISQNRKTIVYFPFKSTVDNIIMSDEVVEIRDSLARYHADMFPEEKKANASEFKSGQRSIMCATKAFGMGIDVSDISEVYHHAPTGCLSDYVQEIGRLARDPQITGIAKIDFSEKDFRYIRKLHGLSAIKPYQLTLVLKKLLAIYKMNGEKRNMLISSSDFSYIFPLAKPTSIDQNLKSCLLLISNDLLNKLRFHALIVRPKSLFTKCFIEVPKSETKDFFRIYQEYLSHITDTIYQLDADKLWVEKYVHKSFPMFKKDLAEGKVFRDFHTSLRNKITLELHYSIEDTKLKVLSFFNNAHSFLNEMSREHHRISIENMKSSLSEYNNSEKEQFIETFRLLYASQNALGGDCAAYCRVFSTDGCDNQNGMMSESFQLISSGYQNVSNLYVSSFEKYITDEVLCNYCDSKDNLVKLCEFLDSLGVASYQRVGGDQPAIFIRINNPSYLNMLVHSNSYTNDILEKIHQKYHYSERVFTYFFTTPMTDSQRWDFIEEYFLGASEEKLLNFIQP